MKNILIVIAILAAPLANAGGPWIRVFQDQHLPTQKPLEHDSWLLPIGASVTQVVASANVASVGGATVVSSFSGQPDYPRNITITPTGNTSNIAAGTAVVSGINMYGKSVSENFAITSSQSTATTGSTAFKTITSISFPQASGTFASFEAGVGTKLGVRHCLDHAGEYLSSEYGGVYETTRGTMAINASVVELNTFIPNGSMNGAQRIDLFYVQNFACWGNPQ